MSVTFAGYDCIDPRTVLEYCRKERLPTSWWGKANRYISPNIGMHPGRGFILLRGKQIEDISNKIISKGYDLVFANQKGSPTTLKNIRIVGDPISLTPGHPSQFKDAVYLVELTDRRIDCIGIANKVYNWRPYPDSNLVTDEKTWYYILKDLWETVGGITEAFPTFSTPDFTSASITTSTHIPWQIDARGARAADILEDLLYLVGLAVSYDIINDVFSIVDTTNFDDAVEESIGSPNAIYQSNNLWDNRMNLPQKVRVCFPVWAPEAANISDNSMVVVDVADTISQQTGTRLTSTFCVVQDMLPARLNELGTIVNSSDLATRASDISTIFFRQFQIALDHRPLYRIFAGYSSPDEFLDGRHVDGVFWQDSGDQYSPGTGICRLGRVGLPPINSYGSITQYSSPTVVTGFDTGGFYRLSGGKTPVVRNNATPSPIDRLQAISNDTGNSGKELIDLFSGMNGGTLFNRSYIKDQDSRTEGSVLESRRRKWFYPAERALHERVIRVTSTTPTANSSSGSGGVGTTNLYPSFEQYYDAASGTYHDGTACWAVDINGGALLVKKYVGLRTDLVASKTVWQVEAFTTAVTSGSGSTQSGSGSGDSSLSWEEEKLRCQSGVLNRYIRTITLTDGAVSFSSWTFADTQGCCACSSGSGSGSSGGTGPAGSGGGSVSCCGRNLAATLWASIPGNGSIALVFNSALPNYWSGSIALACGKTMYLHFDLACGLHWSCIPYTAGPPATESGSVTCSPYFISKNYSVDMDSALVSCTPPPTCGTFSPIVISE